MQYFEQYIFSKKDQAAAEAIKPTITDAKEATAAIHDCFSKSVARSLQSPSGRIGVLLSGGVDSSLLTAYLDRKQGAEAIDCFTIFADAHDSDLYPSKEVSHHLGNRLVLCKVTNRFIDTHFMHAAVLPHAGLYVMTASLALIRVLVECASRNISELWIGNGVDMMFGGGVNPKQFPHGVRDKVAFHHDFWQYSMQLLVNRFYRLGYPEMQTLANRYKVRIVLPFANLDAIRCARSIWASTLFKGGHDKYPVRLLAHQLLVPKREAFRAKRPLQESSGMFNLLEQRMFRELPALVHDGVSTQFDTETLKQDKMLALRLYVALKHARHQQTGETADFSYDPNGKSQ